MGEVRGARVVVRMRGFRDAEPAGLVNHGGAVALDLQRGPEAGLVGCRHIPDLHACAALCEGQSLAVIEAAHGDDLVLKATEGCLFAGRAAQQPEEGISLHCHRPVEIPVAAMVAAFLEVVSKEFRAVNGLAVFAEPLADAMQHASAGLGHDAVRRGTNIEQKVAVSLGAAGEHVENLRLGFPFVVAGMETPALVHRHAGFPRTPRMRRAEMLLRCGEVARQAVAAVEEDVRLNFPNHGVHLL